MTDISKCMGNGCPLREKCYRFTAPSDDWQSYLVGSPYDAKTESCVMFWPIISGEAPERLMRILEGK